MTLDPTKAADLVVVHFTEEVQQLISETQVRSYISYLFGNVSNDRNTTTLGFVP